MVPATADRCLLVKVALLTTIVMLIMNYNRKRNEDESKLNSKWVKLRFFIAILELLQ
jgi:hypothetical protein